MHAGGVDDAIVAHDLRVAFSDPSHASQEQAVAHLHDVGLVHGGHPLAAVLHGVLEGESRHARRGVLGDDLQALDDAGHDLVLEAGVEILGVLPHDHEIDALVPGRHRRDVPDRPQIGEEVERLSQSDVDAGEAAADRRRHRPLERHLVAQDRVEERRRQRRAVPLERQHAGEMRLPLRLEAGGFENLDDGAGDFGTDAVAGDQRDGVFHV